MRKKGSIFERQTYHCVSSQVTDNSIKQGSLQTQKFGSQRPEDMIGKCIFLSFILDPWLKLLNGEMQAHWWIQVLCDMAAFRNEFTKSLLAFTACFQAKSKGKNSVTLMLLFPKFLQNYHTLKYGFTPWLSSFWNLGIDLSRWCFLSQTDDSTTVYCSSSTV